MPSFRSAALVSGWLGFALVSSGGSVAQTPPVIDPPPAPLTPPQAVPSPGQNSSAPPTVRPPVPVRGPEDQPGVPHVLPPVQMTPVPQQGRPMFSFKIAPGTPITDLLPVPPKAVGGQGPVITEDLAKVPEVTFQGKAPETARDGKMGPEGSKIRDAAYQLAKINHLNAQKTDGFMVALLANRRDLEGIPFRMGDDCRATGPKVQYFTEAAELVRRVLAGSTPVPIPSQMVQPVAPNAPVFSTQPISPGIPGSGPGAPPQPVPSQVPQVAPTAAPTPTQLNEPRIERATSASLSQVQISSASLSQINQDTLVNVVLTSPAVPTRSFWAEYAGLCDLEDSSRTPNDKETMEMVTLARVAALTQMLAAESTELRLGLVKYLAGVSHVEATRALARMVIYTKEEDVRQAAIAALKVRREKDYTDILVKALRYPWPAVSRRAAEAIAKLERTDLVPELISLLESSDPRMPDTRETEGKYSVKELVKLNHHQNCMMCHPPADSGVPNPKALKAEVAIQGQPLPSPSEGYRQQNQELFIRIDATYLRPDFSASLPVKDAHPWPEMQRFDFVVRERKLTKEEAAAFREQLATKDNGVLSPYHKGALVALREITGKDTTPNAESWRKMLDLPVKK